MSTLPPPEKSTLLCIEDCVCQKTVTDSQLSPDGTQALIVLAAAAKQPGEPHHSRILLVAIDEDQPGASTTLLTSGPRADVSPRWAPDGRSLIFVSDRVIPGLAALYVLSLQGGEARRLCPSVGHVSQPAWSPDGRQVAYLMAEPMSEERIVRHQAGDDANVAGECPLFTSLWIADVETGLTRRVGSSSLQVWEYDWNPDGKSFVIVASSLPGDEGWFSCRLAILSMDGGESTLLKNTGKQMAVPHWCADGKTIAFLEGKWSDPGLIGGDLCLVSIDGRSKATPPASARSLTAGLPLSIAWFQPANAGRFLCMGYQDHELTLGTVEEASRWAPLWRERITCADWMQPRFSTNRSGNLLALAREDPLHPRDLWTYRLEADRNGWFGRKGRAQCWSQQTRLHPELTARELASATPAGWKSADGLNIQGLVLRPAFGTPPYPLIVQIHGGPTSQWPWRFSLAWNEWGQLLASRGFLVLLPNPRGSLGRGSAFAEANRGELGARDWQDVVTGVDHLIDQGLADPQRLGIGGWSYGGFLTAWGIAQTNRFRAAVVGAGICNWNSFHDTTDCPAWTRSYWPTDPYEPDGPLRRYSPIAQVGKISTPTLILHGQEDATVPVSQARELYRGLQDHGVPVELVTYPREGHAILEEKHQRDLLQRVQAWFETHLMAPQTPGQRPN